MYVIRSRLKRGGTRGREMSDEKVGEDGDCVVFSYLFQRLNSQDCAWKNAEIAVAI